MAAPESVLVSTRATREDQLTGTRHWVERSGAKTEPDDRTRQAPLRGDESRTDEKLSELLDRELKWTQPSAFKMHYELLAGDEPAATLSFRSAFGSLATGESADGCWTFKRVGFFQTRATIRVCGEETDIAVFRNNAWSGGGALELPDGRRLLATTNLWRSNLEFKTDSEEVLLQFRRGGLIHLSAVVEIHQKAIELAELPWLVMFGWYLIVMMNMDAAASAAVIG